MAAKWSLLQSFLCIKELFVLSIFFFNILCNVMCLSLFFYYFLELILELSFVQKILIVFVILF